MIGLSSWKKLREGALKLDNPTLDGAKHLTRNGPFWNTNNKNHKRTTTLKNIQEQLKEKTEMQFRRMKELVKETAKGQDGTMVEENVYQFLLSSQFSSVAVSMDYFNFRGGGRLGEDPGLTVLLPGRQRKQQGHKYLARYTTSGIKWEDIGTDRIPTTIYSTEDMIERFFLWLNR